MVAPRPDFKAVLEARHETRKQLTSELAAGQRSDRKAASAAGSARTTPTQAIRN